MESSVSWCVMVGEWWRKCQLDFPSSTTTKCGAYNIIIFFHVLNFSSKEYKQLGCVDHSLKNIELLCLYQFYDISIKKPNKRQFLISSFIAYHHLHDIILVACAIIPKRLCQLKRASWFPFTFSFSIVFSRCITQEIKLKIVFTIAFIHNYKLVTQTIHKRNT